jgi:soluble lytic murein transglycosylase
MPAPFKLIAACLLAGTVLALPPGFAQSAAEKKAAKSNAKSAAKSKAKSKAKTNAKSSRPAPRRPAPKRAKGGTTNTAPSKLGAKVDANEKTPETPKNLHSVPLPRPEEIEHATRYDKAIAAARDHKLSDADADRIRDAVSAIASGSLTKGKALRDQITDGAGRKLIDWYLHRGGYGTANEIRAFLVANPVWPDRQLLTQRAEQALFYSDAGPAEVKGFFADTPPTTGVGLAALAAALAADKDEAAAKRAAAKAWVELEIPAVHESDVLERIGKLLTEADHKRRLDRLLLGESRWASERKERAATIRRTIARLSAPEKKKAEARLAVFLRSKNAHSLMAKVSPEALATEWGLAVQKAQALRRQNKDEAAWKILLAEPEPTLKVRPDGWWEERRANAYAALRAGKPATAYALVRAPGELHINSHNDACFLAGWIALRYLHDAKKALPHFQALAKSADGPLTRSRGHYWLGRTWEALGNQAKARESYRASALEVDTFHGQLARLELDPTASDLKIGPPKAPTLDDITRFNGLDAVHAAVIAHKAKLDRNLVRAFLIHLRPHLETEAELAMLAHLAEAMGDTQISVRVGKHGVARGFNLIYYAYPVHRMPAYKPLRDPPETAVILGIARQESEFNVTTMSGAGARGILQVMPGTARHICREYGIRCDIPRLNKDAAYNTMFGSAYISDRVDEFAGSYILAIAGYNAGPGRAREWIEEFGDPRDPRVDPIDWIHRIPIQETREYVQRVLSNIQIYRARLGEVNAVRLNADLRRVARSSQKEAAASD